MNYPLISEYIEAIKAAEDNFEELINLRAVLGDDGQPVMTSGNFAVVFKMKDEETGKLYALKCFTKEQEGRAEAYHQIAEELKDVDSPYLVSLRYLDKELFVDTEQTDETEFPVLLMDWVEGKTLDKYLRENLDDKYALEMLAYRFSQLAQWLIPQPFAHGDLKPDNILVREDGTLVLVDYDGMYVPAMKGQKARELGSPDFRHPLRTEDDFDEHIDDFPLVSILLNIKALSLNPILFVEYGATERLMLTHSDYHALSKSRAITAMLDLMSDYNFAQAYSLFLLVYSQNMLPKENLSIINEIVSPITLCDYALKLMDEGKGDDAYVIWYPLAQRGVAQAQNGIGLCYSHGIVVKQDDIEAVKWFSLAAEQGNAKALCNLGMCYADGDGVEEDLPKAFSLFMSSAKQNLPAAKYALYLCYIKGWGIEKNEKDAIKWLKEAVKQEHSKSCYILAKYHEKGQFVQKDEKKAYKLYLKSAELGYKKSQKKLGDIYREGQLGKTKSPTVSFKWYLNAAEQGDSASQFYVGYYYSSGYGVQKDYKLAVHWYTISANQNNSSALNNLAVCCEHGRGTDIDRVKAYFYFEKAASLGDHTAKRNMDILTSSISTKKELSDYYLSRKCLNPEKAFYWMLKAAICLDVDAQRKVAQWYLLGFGTQQDKEKAIIWYAKSICLGDKDELICNAKVAYSCIEKSANSGDEISLYLIGKCYEYGVIVGPNKQEAKSWFEKAAKAGCFDAFKKLRVIKPIETSSTYLKVAKDFESWIEKEINKFKELDVDDIFYLLDKIKITANSQLKVHLANPSLYEVGDWSWFYTMSELVVTGEREGIWENLRVELSTMGVWQAYLLHKASTIMPSYDHCSYGRQNHIYSEEYTDVNDWYCFEISDTAKSDLHYLFANLQNFYGTLCIKPFIGIYENVGIVSCCFWNDWEGLVRENVKFVFKDNQIKEIKRMSSIVIYKYDCGWRF